MQLSKSVLQSLVVDYQPSRYLRALPLVHRATPLGMGYGLSRYSSPNDNYKLVYIAADFPTSIAETIIRDRFVGRVRRRITVDEAQLWGLTEVAAKQPLRLIDLRTTGLLQLGVPTDAAHSKNQTQGRKLAQAIYDQSDANGILYSSRLTGAPCCAVFDRAVSKLSATGVVDMVGLSDFPDTLSALNIDLV